MDSYVSRDRKCRNNIRVMLVQHLREELLNELLEEKYQKQLDEAVYYTLGRNCRGDDDTEWYAEKDRQMRLVIDDLAR